MILSGGYYSGEDNSIIFDIQVVDDNRKAGIIDDNVYLDNGDGIAVYAGKVEEFYVNFAVNQPLATPEEVPVVAEEEPVPEIQIEQPAEQAVEQPVEQPSLLQQALNFIGL